MTTAALGFWSAIATALISAGGTAVMWWLGRAPRKLAERVQQHDQWMSDADKAYKRAEAKADRAEVKCEQCEKKLARIVGAFYGLLEDLEDQIIPMLMMPLADHQETRMAVRAAIRQARERASSP